MNRIASLTLVALLAAACGDGTVEAPVEGPGKNTTATNEDVDAPLTDVDALVAGAPSNDELPSEGKADAVYPAKFTDLIAQQSPVKSQASRGVCSIFSTVALMEHLYIAAGDRNPDFSEQYLQWSVKNEVGAFPNTSGSSADSNVEAISEYGIVKEADWPYETREWNTSNDPACNGGENLPTRCYTNGEPPASAKEATKYKLPAGRWVNSRTDSIKGHMTNKKTAVVIGGTFFYQAWNHRASSLPTNQAYWREGYVLSPNAEDRTKSLEKRAGHSILLVGWDDTLEVQKVDKDGNEVVDDQGRPVMEKGFFIFKNSWGTGSFGVNNPHGDGYGFISYRYVADHMSAVVSGLPELAQPARVELCDDGADNDGNGAADCDDDACATHPSCDQGGVSVDEFTTATAIPDASTTGVTTSLMVEEPGLIRNLTVEVDITHSYTGDLVLTLRKGRKSKQFVAHQGGADDDLKAVFDVDHFDGLEASGEWKLKVVDDAAQDVGTLNRWAIEIVR